jgi:predicted permease
MLDTLWQDLRYALRSLARRPLVSLVAVLSLALGVGVNTAIFSVFDRLLLRSLPVPAPGELVNITSPGPRPGNTSTGDAGDAPHVFTHPLFRDLERMPTPFVAIGVFRDIPANLAFHGETLAGDGLIVSGGYFAALHMRPALGRLLTADDDRAGTPGDVVVLSHRYWTTRFQANPAVLNDTLTVNGVPLTIIGVAAPGFKGTSTMENERFFVPLGLAPRLTRWRDPESRRDWFIYAFGRLAPGVSMAQAEARLRPPFAALVRDVDLPAQKARLDARGQAAYAARTVVLEPGNRGHDANRQETQAILGILLAVTAFVLLIACANVANLLLARATERVAEVAVRLAVGASSLRVFRLMFIESMVLAAAGGSAALLVARLTMAGLLTLIPSDDADVLNLSLDGNVLLFTMSLSLATALVFGIAPAIHVLRRAPDSTPGAAARTTSARATTRMRALLAGGQVALATALLALAGLLVVSLANLTRMDLGVQRAGLSMFRISPVLNGYPPPQSLALFDRIEASLAELPGVVSVSAATIRILDDSSSGSNVTATGFTPGPDSDVHADYTDVAPRYFATLGVPLIAGREFTTADTAGTPAVAIVNEAFVRKFKLGARAIGTRIGTTEGKTPDTEIVGVVADSAYSKARDTPPAQFFRPYRQQLPGSITFYVRTAPGVDPAAVMRAIPGVVHRFDANLPVNALRTMDEQFDQNTTSERVVMTLSSSLAGLATLLAAIGLYAVLAYSVSQRLREIGIRMALGARGADVRAMVLKQTSSIALTACAAGVALAIGLARLSQSMLFGVTGLDPRVQGGAALLMLGVALVAGLLPARRAAAVDPVEALRAD